MSYVCDGDLPLNVRTSTLTRNISTNRGIVVLLSMGKKTTVFLTHAVFHHHKAALISFETLALEVSGSVDTCALAAQIRRNPALVDIYKQRTD